jgi:nucleoside 2-deoxyribosyltransferase
MRDNTLLWPDDEKASTSRDGIQRRMEGRYGYFISGTLLLERPNLLADHRVAITEWLKANDSANVELMTHNIDNIISQREPSTKEKLDRLVLDLAKRCRHRADSVDLQGGDDGDLVWHVARAIGASEKSELLSLLMHLRDAGLATFQITSSSLSAGITVQGLIYVDELEERWGESRNGFVAMWFGDEMSGAYVDAIAPAIESEGFVPVRIDGREHNNKIDDEIVREIRRARFIVADFSCGPDGVRGGVYFEAGYALALGRPVIFTVRAADLHRVHFDTRQFNHIVWEDPVELRARLANRIGATIS